MNKTNEKAVRRQIISLLSVIGAGVLAAFLIGSFFIMHYGPSGRYLVENILLEPKLLHELNYNDNNPKTGGMDRFVFDSIEFAYFNQAEKKWVKFPVSEERYALIYNLIKGEKSLLDPSRELEELFIKDLIARMTIFVKTESSAAWQAITKTFQEVQFENKNNHFRIQLHEQNPGMNWAYFQKSNIANDVLSIFK